MFVRFPTLPRLELSGLVTLESAPRPDQDALEAIALRRAGEQLDAEIAAQEQFGAWLNDSLRDFSDMTEAERAELRFALRCDPELRALIGGK